MRSCPGIYEILNASNGKRYIGQTSNFIKRWSRHRRLLQSGSHNNKHLQSAWNKYGEASFVFSELGRCVVDQLTISEQAWMDVLPHEYNKAPAAGSRLGCKQSLETNAKISKALSGKKKSADHIAALKIALCGRKMPPVSIETREKLSRANRGRKLSPCSDEKRLKISKSKRGVPWSAARYAAQGLRK